MLLDKYALCMLVDCWMCDYRVFFYPHKGGNPKIGSFSGDILLMHRKKFQNAVIISFFES